MNRLRAYAQLVRLPNVFTALADIVLGGLAVGVSAEQGLSFALLLFSSACLYMGGMVWNDFFDIEQDRRERPFRPLPSGRLTRRAAGVLGAGLLAAGLLFAAASGLFSPLPRFGGERLPVPIAVLLIAAILLYDAWLKRTWAGPLGMGTCRFLNVLLGLSLAASFAQPWMIHLALVVGLYIVAVTWFARTEAQTSQRWQLTGAALVMLVSLVIALPLPIWFPPGTSSPLFPYLLVVLGFLVGHPVRQAIVTPQPRYVQKAVKRAIFGLVVFDAVLATAVAGSIGLIILLLLVPILALGRWRWLYAT